MIFKAQLIKTNKIMPSKLLAKYAIYVIFAQFVT